MKQTLQKLNPKPVLLIEVAWPNEHPNWKLQLEEFRWLFDNGYQEIDFTNKRGTQDVLFLPK